MKDRRNQYAKSNAKVMFWRANTKLLSPVTKRSKAWIKKNQIFQSSTCKEDKKTGQTKPVFS